ncbi:MAG: hypothetical protein WCH74_00855 [Chloroflexota bacterium]
MTLQLHRPDGERGLETRPNDPNWRDSLRSPRWNLPALANPEMNPTSTARSVAFWLVLAALTFVLLLAGYGTNVWK